MILIFIIIIIIIIIIAVGTEWSIMTVWRIYMMKTWQVVMFIHWYDD